MLYCLRDLDTDCYGEVRDGAFVFFDVVGYPRKTWWKFWRKRTQKEFIFDEHKKYSAERKCHVWEGQEFHFCAK